ncbi:MAG: hypothetical protein WDO13_04580 [Verrucomicrobiota bacterium]
MNTLKDTHPDIEEFILAKQKEERKAWALIEQGYDGSYNGEAYGSIMYQNENLSVRASDTFMEAGRRRQGSTGPAPCVTARTARRSARRTCSTRSPRAPGSAATRACSSTTPSTAGTPARAPTGQHSTNPCSEYLFPQQHGLQSRLAQPDEVQEGRRIV